MNFYLFILLLFILSCNPQTKENEVDISLFDSSIYTKPEVLAYEMVNTFPHDTTSFTEGLLFHNGILYESTGSPDNLPQTKSVIGAVDLQNGNIITKTSLDRNIYFGEGIAFLNDKFYQLTYQNRQGFIYDATTFRKIGSFNIPNEGWGLTTDGVNLIMSDGSNKLAYLQPSDLKIIKTINVKQEGRKLDLLNELEYINGYIYANVFTTNQIVKIDPLTGYVIGVLDLTPLYEFAKGSYKGSMELNGIAYDSAAKKIFVTGKMWPNIYQIKFKY